MLPLPLNDEEKAALQKSAQVVREAIDALDRDE
jgi:malate/lactate dehydrogenase